MSVSVSDSFASLLIPDLCTNTDAFLTVYRAGITLSSEPIAALTRFSVYTLTANKSKMLSEHEVISVSVKDEETNQSYNFFIERNSSKSEVRASTHSPLFLDSSSLSTTSTSAPQVVKARQSSEFPLLPLNPSSESVSSLLPPPRTLRSRSQYSLREKFTLASTEFIQSSTTSLDGVAEDRILGRGMLSNKAILRDVGQVVRQSLPIMLSLFELGILVDVVHNEDPDYSLLKSQCYWFLYLIFEVIILLYGDNLNTAASNRVTPVEYLPNLAGRWKNQLIIAPKDEILRKVATKFLERREEEFSRVNITVFWFIYWLTIQKVRKAHQESVSRENENAAMRDEIQLLLQRIDQLKRTDKVCWYRR